VTPARPGLPPASRLASWFATSLIVGWIIAYNVLRIAGESPRGAALVALAPGIVLGLVILAATIAIWRRGGAERAEAEVPPPEALDRPALNALRLAAGALGALALAAIVVGVVLAYDWSDTPASSRSTAKIVIAGWDVLAGAWLATEAPRLSRGYADALEPISLAAVLTAVLAGVGISRDWVPGANVVLIVIAGLAAGGSQLGLWRATGGRGRPVGAVLAVAIAILALVLPLAA